MALRMYEPESSSELPTSCSACSSDQVPPSLPMRSYSAAIQSGSVSANVPSKSHSAAARCGGCRVAHGAAILPAAPRAQINDLQPQPVWDVYRALKYFASG